MTPHEALALIRSAVDVERPVIHLELRLWFRRIEVRRLRAQDIKEDLFDVHGKGRCGGKWRSVAWGPDTLAVLMEWEEEREQMIEAARSLNPNAAVPAQWIIYRRGRHLGAYGNTAIDNIVASAARRAGIERGVSNHTLRRTGGRIAYFAGVPLVEIMEGMGHTTEKQTVRYLGLRVDELKKAQERIYAYLQELEKVDKDRELLRPIPERRISR
ncbi:MAG: tyrosine-type recombinase/integrase [Euryarchaeota archaeon]|nr:tyrosine-type recombinase/integrase [Euryarchaeota archaeon]